MTLDINSGITRQAHQIAVQMCIDASITGPTAMQSSLNKSLWFILQAILAGFGSGGGTSIPVIGKVAVDGTLQPGSTGIASVVHAGSGNYTINFTTPFANTNYKPFLTEDVTQGQNVRYQIISGSQMSVMAFADSAFTIIVFP